MAGERIFPLIRQLQLQVKTIGLPPDARSFEAFIDSAITGKTARNSDDTGHMLFALMCFKKADRKITAEQLVERFGSRFNNPRDTLRQICDAGVITIGEDGVIKPDFL